MSIEGPEQPGMAQLADADLVALGSGAAGLTAALTAALEGLSAVVLEISPSIGGTTARSSGTIWIPDNHLMRAAGFPPDREAAETYLGNLIGNRAPREGWLAFLEHAPRMLLDLERRANIAFRPYLKAPDYRSNDPGAASGGRALEPVAFDGQLLGEWFNRLALPIPELTVLGGMMVTRAEAQKLVWAERSVGAMRLGLSLLTRHLRDRLHYPRGTRLVMGNGLVARLLHEALRRGVRVLPNAHVRELLTDRGKISGVRGVLDGKPFVLRARSVVLAGGGFPADPEMCTANLPPAASIHTPAGPFACGTSIRLGLAAGGQLGPSLGSNGMWFPSSLWSRPAGGLAVHPHIALDRAKPGSLIVNRHGERFANEALSYHDFCEEVFRHGEDAVPAWMIVDRDFIHRYGLGVIRPRTRSLQPYVESGYLKAASSPEALAAQIGVPGEALARTIERCNSFARSGQDEDFHRGESAYQRSNGDPDRRLKNPCLGPINPARLHAVSLWPTPLATARGLVCGTNGEVLDQAGDPIHGLYAAGGDMQSVFGGQYPGAGAQIGQAMTFAWAAARHTANGLKQE